MRRVASVLVLWLIACAPRAADHAPTAAGEATPVAGPPIAPPAAPDRVIAVVQLGGVWSECSNAGGEHAALVIEPGAGAPRYAHVGGHAVRLGLIPAGVLPTAGWFVAELAMMPRVDEDHDDNPDSSGAGWCLDGMPRFDAEVLRLWDATDRADAERRAAIAGAPAIALSKAPIARVVIARVRTAEDGSARTRYALDAVVGAAPASIDVPSTSEAPFRPMSGELLVIALDAAGAPVGALAARDRVDADRRAAMIQRTGWPALAAPRFTWWFASAFEPITAIGEIVAGRAGCGDDLVIGPATPDAELRRAAAPVHVTAGDRVTAVVEPKALDACGRALRVLRAFRTPDAHDSGWLAHGPPPGEPIAE
ncbi:MAG: hypothetical protein K8W52_23710 [Deltaproteobacteria bacterium]|nr:hypothetical protein [Deltaproteobacteria bacterium]